MDAFLRIFEAITELTKAIVWPCLCLIFLYLFRDSLSDLIRRIKKVGNKHIGIETASRVDQQEGSMKGPANILSGEYSNAKIDNFLGSFDDATITSIGDSIKELLKTDTMETAQDKANCLFRYSQALNVYLRFETIYKSIYGSQLKLLLTINGKEAENKDSLKIFYDTAFSDYPTVYANYSYDQYLDYLSTNQLIVLTEEGRVGISIFGRDFLTFINRSGYSIDKVL